MGSVEEPLLAPDAKRRALFPIVHNTFWERYKKALACFWVPNEVDLSADLVHWHKKLTSDERYFVSLVLSFFAVADSIVADNLAERFSREVQPYEAKIFYDFQKSMENIHAEMYSLLIDAYIADPKERQSMQDAIESFPCIKKKTDWALRWIESSDSFATRLVAFAVVEGVFFSGSFCAIFWLKKRGLMPGLSHANQLIARDEGMHQEFATHLYSQLTHKLSDDTVHEIVDSAVQVEIEFCTEACKVDMIGMNARQMGDYIQFVADRLMAQLGVRPLYNASNPFPWMEVISLEGKTNFFEFRVSEYQKAGVKTGELEFSTEADF